MKGNKDNCICANQTVKGPERNAMNFKQHYYPESRFGGFTDIDGTVIFYNHINALIEPDFTLLDFGCGRGEYVEDAVAYRKALRIFNNKCKRVIGADVDETARHNPYIDEFVFLENGGLPLPANSVDITICDWVLEHIEEPDQFFNEMQRIIKPGGYLCIRTSNRWSYVSVIAQIIHEKYHSKLLTIAQPGRNEMDVFPKYFRCNSITALKSALMMISDKFVVYGYEGEPAYLNFSRWAFLAGVIFHKWIPETFRTTLLAFAQLD